MSVNINLISPPCVLHYPIWESERWLRKETWEPSPIILSTTPRSNVIFFFSQWVLSGMCNCATQKHLQFVHSSLCAIPFSRGSSRLQGQNPHLLHSPTLADSLPLSYLGSPHCSIGRSISLFPKRLAYSCKSGFFQVRNGVLFTISENKDVIVINDSSPPMWAEESQGHPGRRKILAI